MGLTDEEGHFEWGMGLMCAYPLRCPREARRGLVGSWRLLPCCHGDGSGEVGKVSFHEVAFALVTGAAVDVRVATPSTKGEFGAPARPGKTALPKREEVRTGVSFGISLSACPLTKAIPVQ